MLSHKFTPEQRAELKRRRAVIEQAGRFLTARRLFVFPTGRRVRWRRYKTLSTIIAEG